MRLVIIESPYAGEVERNIGYLKNCLKDSLARGEAPFASHLFYTQFLDDSKPEERKLGIDAGLAWRRVAQLRVFYVDFGWSGGMIAARKLYDEESLKYHIRTIECH